MNSLSIFCRPILSALRTMGVAAGLCAAAMSLDPAWANNDNGDSPVITIQAEDYIDYYDTTRGNAGGQYRNDDVDIWSLYPGIKYVGANATGEWLEYTIDISLMGNFRIDIRVATANTNRRMHVEVDGVDVTGPITIPNTGGWTNWQTISKYVLLSGYTTKIRLIIDNGGFNIDSLLLTQGAKKAKMDPPIFAPNNGPFTVSLDIDLKSAEPGGMIYVTADENDPAYWEWYQGGKLKIYETTTFRAFVTCSGWECIPMQASDVVKAVFVKAKEPWRTLQAEDYDSGGQGVSYFDTTSGNAGAQYRGDDVDIWRYGANIYYTGANATGEWLDYTLEVPFEGNFRLDFRLATPNSNRRMHVEIDGADVSGPISIPNTGGWTKWRTVSKNVLLSQGRQTLRLVFDRGGLNFDRVSLAFVGDERIWYGDFRIYSNYNPDYITRLTGYTSVTGDLEINGTLLTDLAPLNSLVSVGGGLGIFRNRNLENLAGLNNLVTVAGRITIGDNDLLTDIDGLNGLVSAGGIAISDNQNLFSLDGLESLTSVNGDLTISYNENLSGIDGLSALESVGGTLSISGTQGLTNLTGLRSLTTVGGLRIVYSKNFLNLIGCEGLNSIDGDLVLLNNPKLMNLDGLNQLAAVAGNLEIEKNPLLNNLDELNNFTTVSGGLIIKRNDVLTRIALDNLNEVGALHVCGNPLLDQALVEALRDQLLSRGGIGGKIDIGPWCY